MRTLRSRPGRLSTLHRPRNETGRCFTSCPRGQDAALLFQKEEAAEVPMHV
jgi:hypothetical protein